MSLFLQAVCGALGSAVAITVLYPLETVRTRLQVERGGSTRSPFQVILNIVRTEGGRSLYKGLPSLVFALVVTNFIYFYVFHGLRIYFHNGEETEDSNSGTDLICGVVAGVAAVLLTNPIWVINTRLKLQGVPLQDRGESKQRRHTSAWACLLDIIQKEGAASLWSGTTSSLLLVSNPCIQFCLYEALKRSVYLDGVMTSLQINSAARHLLNGGIAKFVATVFTYPLQVVQTQRRAGGQFSRRRDATNSTSDRSSEMSKRRSSLLSVVGQASTIIRRDGVSGLFLGIEAKLLQTVLNSALMFLVYEEFVAAVALAGVVR